MGVRKGMLGSVRTPTDSSRVAQEINEGSRDRCGPVGGVIDTQRRAEMGESRRHSSLPTKRVSWGRAWWVNEAERGGEAGEKMRAIWGERLLGTHQVAGGIEKF